MSWYPTAYNDITSGDSLTEQWLRKERLLRPREIVFIWENFGPYHHDRCEAMAAALGQSWKVYGIELVEHHQEYGWETASGVGFIKETLFVGATGSRVPFVRRLWATLRACTRHPNAEFFLCHYENLATLLLAGLLRCTGRRVHFMGNSKFDDYKRRMPREIGKSLFLLPYCGFLTSSKRSSQYLRFLGVPKKRIRIGYNSVSIDRIRRMAGLPPAPGGTPFAQRHFTIIARLIPKKNLAMALEAYALYAQSVDHPRPLYLCGSGALEADLRAQAQRLAIEPQIEFRGWLQAEDICRTLGTTLALLLPSIEEQYGNVVIEAQAMGLPIILSENCGARDYLVRSGVNGFVIEPDNPKGLAYLMRLLCQDQSLWTGMANASCETAVHGDVQVFTEAIRGLIGLEPAAVTLSA